MENDSLARPDNINNPQPPPAKKPLRPKTQLFLSILIIALVVIVTVLLFRYPQRLGPIFVKALVVTLASFLVLLILRHFLLVWFSYLHARELANDDPPESFPFVSIIVPAFNEVELRPVSAMRPESTGSTSRCTSPSSCWWWCWEGWPSGRSSKSSRWLPSSLHLCRKSH